VVALERESPRLAASEHESWTKKRSHPETRHACVDFARTESEGDLHIDSCTCSPFAQKMRLRRTLTTSPLASLLG
jgi:hypothetical protein